MADSAATGQGRSAGILLAILAVIGWGLAIFFWLDRGSIHDELAAALEAERGAHAETRSELAMLEDTAGRRDELQTIVDTLRSERDELEAERDAIESEFAAERQAIGEKRAALLARNDAQRRAVQAVMAAERQQLAAFDQQLGLGEQALRALDAELAPLREELGSFDERLAEAERSLVARTRELSAVGERLEAARTQEAEIRAELARLNEDAAARSQEALAAEERLQAAREAEAQLEVELAAAREAFSRIEAEQAGLEEQVRTLEERRAVLIDDTDAARAQRETLQAALLELSATLAARSDEAAQVEARIAELLGQDAALDRAVAAGILPGQYRMGPVSARFTSDGRFEMANADSGEEVTGRYTVEEGRLTLDRVEGDTGWLEFPVECEVAPEALGFSLQGSNGCEMFSGTLFEKVR